MDIMLRVDYCIVWAEFIILFNNCCCTRFKLYICITNFNIKSHDTVSAVGVHRASPLVCYSVLYYSLSVCLNSYVINKGWPVSIFNTLGFVFINGCLPVNVVNKTWLPSSSSSLSFSYLVPGPVLITWYLTWYLSANQLRGPSPLYILCSARGSATRLSMLPPTHPLIHDPRSECSGSII